ncbi:MAG: Gfo/Idh/MocA family oxidoreductase [Candidatus Omnitrophica bacterium]|nr:Gfo/Idh/MocA family oxidoreductase [Candidatus Omnitrophota bacterium]
MKKMRVAVIGVGHLGAIHGHIYNALPNVELIGVCDTFRQRAQAVAQQLEVKPYYRHADLLRVSLDAVSIAVPTNAHYSVARDFLKRGVHTLIEKPISTSLREARTLTKLAEKHNCILQVGHVERFNTAIEALRDIAVLPKFIEVHRLGPFTKRSLDIGVVLDLMIHDIDIILSLVNSEVKKVEAVGVKVLSPYEDIANARIMFANGSVANITASRLTPEAQRKIRVFIKDAYISLDYARQEAFLYRKRGKRIFKKRVDIKKEQPLQRELRAFIRCVKKKAPPIVSGKDASRALALALTIEKHIRKSFRKK